MLNVRNSYILHIAVFVFCAVGCFSSSYAFADSDGLLVGYADVDITPSLGVTMPGYFNVRHATGVLDPLRVKALTLSLGETTLAIVACDLIGIPAPVVENIRTAVREKTGLPAECVFVHATHTHTGATVSEIQNRLPAQVADAVHKSLGARVAESHASLGTGREYRVAYIRRYLMTDGTVRTNPGRANPKVVRPIGEIDPTVYALTFSTAKTMLVSFGLHLDCIGGDKFSADYPYHLTQAIKDARGADWNVVYLNAFCGNVNHINVNDRSQRSGYDESRRIGRCLAETALSASKNALHMFVDCLSAAAETVDVPVRKVPDEIYQWAKQQMRDNPEEANKRKFNERTPFRIVRLAERPEKTVASEVIAFRIGPVALVGLPAEVFKEVGDDIKTHSPIDPTLTIGITGGYMGYVPHPRGYDEGGYEATYGSARHAPETPILWANAAARMVNAMANANE